MGRRVAMLLSNACVADPRVEKEARSLVAAGHEVTVVAWDREGDAAPREERDGFTIERHGPRARHGAGVRGIGGYRRFWREAARAAVRMSAQVVHCHDADTLPAGLRAARLLGDAALVCDFHERYSVSQMVPQRGVTGMVARRAVDALEARAVRRSSLVVVANPSALEHYRRLAGGREVLLVENAPESESFAAVDRRAPGEPLTVCYVGRKRYLAPLAALIEAVARTEGTFALIAGDGPREEEVARLARSCERVRVVGRVLPGDVPALYRGCGAVYAAVDAGVANAMGNVPVKVYEAMAAGLPAIVSAGSAAAGYVENHRVGLAVDASDADAVAAVLARLRDDSDACAEMGRRGREIIQAGFDWRHEAERLTAAYERF